MKKLMILSLGLSVICGSAFAAQADFTTHSNAWENFSQNLKVINICELADNDLNEIMQGKHAEIAVEFSAQTTLPVGFFLKGDLVNLVENEENFGAVEIKQTFYVRCVQQELIFSTNLSTWKPFLTFATGTAMVSISIQDGKPFINLEADVNQRS